MRARPSPSIDGLLFVAFAALSLAIFFRFDLLTGFQYVFGDIFDGNIEVSILEHWYSVFRGHAHWSQTFAFYPAKGTLGYNDGYFVFGVIYAAARSVGADPFIASEIVNAVVKLAGFAGFYVFARRALGMQAALAGLGASIFTISNGSYIQGAHAQLFTVAFAPILATLLHRAFLALAARRKRALGAWLAAASLFFSAWLVTAFYTAWFFTFFCAIAAVILLCTAHRATLRPLAQSIRACWLPLLLSLAILLVTMIPFFALYLPRAAETGMHSVAETVQYLLAPSDTLALGGRSLLYSDLLGGLEPSNSERATGFTPALLLLFTATTIAALIRRGTPGVKLIRAIAIASVICWALALSIGGRSLWPFVYAYVPGAKAIRVVSRIQLFLAWPVVTVAITGLHWVSEAARRRAALDAAALGASALIGLFIGLEQINSWQVPALDRPAELRWLQSLQAPPPACKAFYASNARPADPHYGRALSDLVGFDIDSMLAAEWLVRPTINGFATFVPPNWDLLSIDRPDYLDRVRLYATRLGIADDLCGLDLATGVWNAHPLTP